MANLFKTVIFAIPQGLSVTWRYLFSKPVTVQYPEEKVKLSPRYRGLHYLARQDDGKEKCVACGLCAAVCPAECIYMEPEENELGERYAKVYEINEIRCIFCGYCEEACPKEAIFLGKEYEFSNDSRVKMIYTKQDLLVPLKKEKT